MCGIGGFFQGNQYAERDKEHNIRILNAMKQSIHHRGPDSNGIYLDKRCGLAHTRLAIIDLADGTQPMKRTIGGNEYAIVYNGELYNTEELRNKLQKKGWEFRTTSDTEVILLSFLQYGADFVNLLDGIFAFAIYDQGHEKVYLYRDSFGVKPLFYTVINRELIFGSEQKVLFCHPYCKPKVSKRGLQEIFGIGPARIPGSGVYDGVYEVKPGSYISFSRYGLQSVSYWRIKSYPHEDDYTTTIQKTGDLVESAIHRQMVSDVPICTFLSGGIDSSLVSSICSTHLMEEGKQLNTFSFDFDGNEKYFKANAFQPSQDRPYVDEMVSYLDSKHTYLSCDYEAQENLLRESVKAHDLPCMADVDSSLLHFCRIVSKSQKVVLTGECADEVFGGYPWFHRAEFFGKESFPWTLDLSPRSALLRTELVEKLQLEEFCKEVYYEAIREIEPLATDDETEANRRQISYLNIRFFMQTLLNRMDRTSMHWGLEARVPFADRALVEYVFNIPWEMKAKNGLVKNILRQCSIGKLPDGILFRKKSPYPKSYHPFYEELLIQRLRGILKKKSTVLNEFLDMEKLEIFLGSVKDYGKPWYGQLMAGPQMIAYLLQIHYWFEEYGVDLA